MKLMTQDELINWLMKTYVDESMNPYNKNLLKFVRAIMARDRNRGFPLSVKVQRMSQAILEAPDITEGHEYSEKEIKGYMNIVMLETLFCEWMQHMQLKYQSIDIEDIEPMWEQFSELTFDS